jgi:hypothetical protein
MDERTYGAAAFEHGNKTESHTQSRALGFEAVIEQAGIDCGFFCEIFGGGTGGGLISTLLWLFRR